MLGGEYKSSVDRGGREARQEAVTAARLARGDAAGLRCGQRAE